MAATCCLEAEPYRRHAEAHRHALAVEQLAQAGAVEAGTRQYQLRAVHRRDIRHAPAADVEHRHDRADDVAARQRDGVRQRGAEGVQQGRAVAVENAFRPAGGPRGVAQRRGAPLVELGPLETVFALGIDQLVIDAEHRQAGFRRFEQDKATIGRQQRPQPLDERDEAGFDEQQPVLRVVDDVDDLLVEQPRVDRVADSPDAGDAVIQLEMAVGVPGERADPVGRPDAEPQQGPRQPPRAALGLGVACSGGSSRRPGARRSRCRRESAPRGGSASIPAAAVPTSSRASLPPVR